jgi:hypothetical protein
MSQKRGQLKRQRSASFDDDDKEDNRFKAWMDEINKILVEKINLRIVDLPDEDFRAIFDEDVPSNMMAKIMIDEYLGFF